MSATVSNYGFKASMQKKINWGNTNTAKCSFVPLFLFKLGVKTREQNNIWEGPMYITCWYWSTCGIRSFLEGMNKILVQSVSSAVLYLMEPLCGHVSGAPWNLHALCVGPKALHRNCCPCCTMLHRCKPHWVAPKNSLRLAARCLNLTENDEVRFSIFHYGLLLPSSK